MLPVGSGGGGTVHIRDDLVLPLCLAFGLLGDLLGGLDAGLVVAVARSIRGSI